MTEVIGVIVISVASANAPAGIVNLYAVPSAPVAETAPPPEPISFVPAVATSVASVRFNGSAGLVKMSSGMSDWTAGGNVGSGTKEADGIVSVAAGDPEASAGRWLGTSVGTGLASTGSADEVGSEGGAPEARVCGAVGHP